MDTVAANLEVVRERIARAAARSGRAAQAVTLVAVTKSVPVSRIKEAQAAGVSHFGENRVQEAEAKYAVRPPISGPEPVGAPAIMSGGPEGTPAGEQVARQGITLHMIGTLQSNKVRRAVALFDWVQSVDRVELVHALATAVERLRPGLPLPVLLQVNVTGEPTKSGVAPAQLPALAGAVAACRSLQAMGLMTIARLGADEAELRRTFSTLRALLDNLRATYPGEWVHLSMGMSDDYELAIEEGATMVRLGRAIFGERPA
jgi:pyridoxal phosphate enzyme (YggS family)